MAIFTTQRNFARLLIVNVLCFVVLAVLIYIEKWIIFGLPIAVLTLIFNLVYIKRHFANPLLKITTEIANLLANKKYSQIVYKVDDEFGLIAYFFNFVTKNIENVSQYLKEGTRMASELSMAREIQKSVLPSTIPKIPKLDIVVKTRSAEEVGGDSFDIQENKGDYYLYLGDVTGHGAPAGLIMMMVNTLFDLLLPTVNNTKELAVKINEVLKPRVNSSLFMTSIFLRWNVKNEQMFYTGAGHEHVIIYRAKEDVCEVFPTGGIALAMADDISGIVSEKQILLGQEDMIVLYSDGITEAVNQKGELFGLERLRQSVGKNGHLGNSLDLFAAIAHDVQAFVEVAIQKDDMSLLVIRYTNTETNDSREQNLVSTRWYE